MGGFESTIWTEIRAAGAGRSTAIDDLVARYRPAVLRFARRKGVDDAEAEDVAQEVFLQVFHDRILERADRNKGRFRSLLLAVTRNVLGHHFERKAARKRGGGRAPVSLAADDRALDELVATDVRDPEFDREWLAALIASALRRLELENPNYHRSLVAFRLGERDQREIARSMGKTEADVRNYVLRGRAKLAKILRDEVTSYASSPGELEEELRYLARFLERP